MNLIQRVKRFQATAVALAAYVVFSLYPLLVVVLNPAPSQDTITVLAGKFWIDSGRRRAVEVQSTNGSITSLALPSANYAAFKGYVDSVVDERLLMPIGNSCIGTAGIDRTKVLPFAPVNRVWWIKCGGVTLEYERTAAAYHQIQRSFRWINAITQIVVLAFCSLIAYVDWRKIWLASRSTV